MGVLVLKLYVQHPEVFGVQIEGKGSHQSNTTVFNTFPSGHEKTRDCSPMRC